MTLDQQVSSFQNHTAPEETIALAGYSALIHAYDLPVPPLRVITAISKHHKYYTQGLWNVFTPPKKPRDTVYDHLVFAFKYEGVNLLVLKKLFEAAGKKEVTKWVKVKPTGNYGRRLWFFYEWLTGDSLNIPDTTMTNYTDAIDNALQYAGHGTRSRRHQVINNLPGTIDFCPLIHRTETLEAIDEIALSKRIRHILEKYPEAHIVQLLTEYVESEDKQLQSKENLPDHNKASWRHLLERLNSEALSAELVNEIHDVLIRSSRLSEHKIRDAESVTGDYNNKNQLTPNHIGARATDIPALLEGLIETAGSDTYNDIGPLRLSASISFGLLLMRPYMDGNRRMMHYITHQIFSKARWLPKDFPYPITLILPEAIYQQTAQDAAYQLLPYIDWKQSGDNITIKNETIDYYRYADATYFAECFLKAIEYFIQKDLARILHDKNQHDKLKLKIARRFELPNHYIDQILHLLEQQNGKLEKSHLPKILRPFTEEEIEEMRHYYQESFH